MKLVVLSRAEAMKFKCDEPWATISITDVNSEFPELDETNRVGILQQKFDDTNARRPGSFTSDQAFDILRFAENVAMDIEKLMIHCHAGVSRSPAVAAALYKLIMNDDDSFFFQRYVPNTLVYRTILEVAHRQFDMDQGKFVI